MKQNRNEKNTSLLDILIAVLMFFAALSLVGLVLGFILRVFGVSYRSIGCFILFFLISSLVAYPMNAFAKAIPKMLLMGQRLNARNAVFLFLVLDTLASFIGFGLVDHFMRSVSANDFSLLLMSFLFALTDVYVNRK